MTHRNHKISVLTMVKTFLIHTYVIQIQLRLLCVTLEKSSHFISLYKVTMVLVSSLQGFVQLSAVCSHPTLVVCTNAMM